MNPAVRPASWLLLGLATLAAACATDQQHDVDAWRQAVTLGPRPDWQAGAPLSLATAARLANEQNERLAIAGEDFVQACAARARITAGFFPQVDLVPSYTFREHAASGVRFLDSSELLDVPLRGQLNLFEGFRGTNRAKAASLTVAQRQALLLDLRETVVLEVVQAYYRVLRAERRTALLDHSLAVQQQRVRELAARERIGTARALDRTAAEAQAARTQADQITAAADARTGREALVLLTGEDVHSAPLHDDFVVPAARPTAAALLAVAVERRQDLQAAALAAEAARARVDVALGQYFPTVGVSLDYFLSRESLPTDRDWTGLLTLNFPLFAAGRIAADVQEAWSQFRQEVLRYSLLRRSIHRDLVTALDDLSTLEARLVELRKQTVAAAEAVRQAEAGARAGLGTHLDLLLAQDQLQRSEVDVAEGELQRKVAWLLVLRATGALTAGAVDVAVPPPPPPRPVPESPFVHLPAGD